MKRPFTVFASIAIAGAIALTGCSSSPSGSSTPINGVTLIKSGVLTVCTHLPFQPMEYKDDSGQVVGFEIDLMNLVAQRFNATVSIVEIDPGQMSSGTAMVAKKCDIAAEGMTITDARAQAVNFSIPYYGVNQSLAVATSSSINSLADMSGKNLGVEATSTGEQYATENATQYGYQMVSFDDGATLMNSILSGRTDAVLFDDSYVSDFVNNNSGIRIADEIATGEVYGFACAKNDNGAALIAVVNDVLQTANSDGTYLSIYKKWINKDATSASLPPTS